MPKSQIPATITVDFSNVEDRREGGGKAAHVPPGDYLLKPIGVEKKWKKGEESGAGYLNWRCAIVAPEKYANAGTVWFITSLIDENLWNLRNFLNDMGIKTPKDKISVPLQQIIAKGPIFGATLDDDTYNDKTKSKIQATFKKSEYEATEAEDEEETSDDSDDEAESTPASSDDEDLEELELDDL